MNCKAVLKTGKRVGKACGRQNCGIHKQQRGGSNDDVSLVYIYANGTSDIDKYTSVSKALTDGFALFSDFSGDINANRNDDVSVWRNNVWSRFLGNKGAVNVAQLKQQIIRTLPKLEISVNNNQLVDKTSMLAQQRAVTLGEIMRNLDL